MAKHKLHGLLNKELIMILLNNKLRIILFMLCIFIFVMPTNLALPFLYDSDKEPLQVVALDPRIPSWYSVKDWEVKYCLNYANEKDAIEVRTSPDNKNTDFGNVISAQAYKSTVPNPDDPTKTTFLYEVSYFVMPGKEVTYKVQLLKSLISFFLSAIIPYIKKAVTLYINSFRKLKKFSWRIVISMLIDFVYLISIIAILMFANAKLAYHLQSETLPLAKEIGVIRSAQMNTINQETGEINIKQLEESSQKIPSILSGLKSSLKQFLFVLGISLILIIILTTIFKTINWSFVRDSFKDFGKFMFYNLVWVAV